MGCTASTTDNNNSNAKAENPTINASNNLHQKEYGDQDNLLSNQNNGEEENTDDLDPEEDEEEEEEEPQELSKEEAALKIQSNYRGYKTRQEFKQKQSVSYNKMKEEEGRLWGTLFIYSQVLLEMKTNSLYVGQTSGNVTDENKAATTIQAGFKGYKVRKEIKKQKSETNSDDGNTAKGGDKDSVTDEIVKNDQ